jgi:hypothetical protein
MSLYDHPHGRSHPGCSSANVRLFNRSEGSVRLFAVHVSERSFVHRVHHVHWYKSLRHYRWCCKRWISNVSSRSTGIWPPRHIFIYNPQLILASLLFKSCQCTLFMVLLDWVLLQEQSWFGSCTCSVYAHTVYNTCRKQ